MEMYTYPITVEREGRKYWAYSEDFPGVYGLGNSLDEAKASILEAMRLDIEECRALKRTVRLTSLLRFLPKNVVRANPAKNNPFAL